MGLIVAVLAVALAPWQNPQVNSLNRLPARARTFPAETSELALAIARGEKPRDASRWVKCLDGEWDFRWKRSPECDWEKTGKIVVPSCWQLQGDYDPPLYTAKLYPFAFDASGDPMGEPDKTYTSATYRNPVGLYRTTFRCPSGWKGRRTILRFEVVSSAFYLRMNGHDVGYAEDSRLPSEFDVSSFLEADGGNAIEVEVYKHSDGSFLECQDFWRLSGIFRSVYLYSESKSAPTDTIVETELTDDFKVGRYAIRDAAGRTLKSGEIARPKLWSSETPEVYVETLATADGGEHFAVSFGFRKIEFRDGVLSLNGKRLVVKGVNRHEMEPGTAYTVTRREMERDIRILCDFNVNAVRTCHYPDEPDWYDLCDRAGIMLVAEANVETHGAPGGNKPKNVLANDPRWEAAHVERGTRMIAFYRNHPSVVFWSIGNESGEGPNLLAAYRALKAMDATRPVQYEGERKLDFSDIKCPMYMRPDKSENYLKGHPRKPLIHCEYSHAMGNSNGGVKKYWDLVRKYPQAQGGFIWDFADQALWKTDGHGKWLAYGGDFGDVPNSGNVNCNGVVDALRNPHPGFYEVKHCYRPVHVESFDWTTGVATVSNGFLFTDLRTLDGADWMAVDGSGQETSRGALGGLALAPGGTKAFALKGFVGESVTIRFRRNGNVLAWDSFTKPFVPKPLQTSQTSQTPQTSQPFKLNFWRAPTDNDQGWKMPKVCKVWKDATKSQKLPEGVTSELKVSAVADGSTFVDWTLVVPEGLPPIPRVGLTFTVPATDGRVEYVGLGPWENYSDRASAAVFGRYVATVGLVSGLADPKTGTIAYPDDRLNPDNYIEPGEQGYRTGCRRLTVGGVTIEAVNAPFGFNVWPCSQKALEGKKHQWELKVAKELTVNVDAVQMGVGGDNSWGFRPHDEYMPGAGTYRLSFVMKRGRGKK